MLRGSHHAATLSRAAGAARLNTAHATAPSARLPPGLTSIALAELSGLRFMSSSGDPVFKKLLAANRGEIAIRIMRAATELNIPSAGIFAYADRYSMHRYKADESYMVGTQSSTPVGAYLDYEKIIEIAKAHGVEAIHPGYGFLSENPDFADACAREGIVFVGPSGDVIRRFGSKPEAREIAISNGVPVVPGTPGPIETVEEAKEFIDKYGLPVIVKAAYGGGGRGMRIINNESEIEESFNRAKSEAVAAFGNGTVFIEKYLAQPRHIEVQILADKKGNVIHLGERDCSVQRRHQKVVEYAPALGLSDETREALLSDAVKLAKAVKYENAGTVEFLVDQDGSHYFMEVNPRVQVEHTVTEEVSSVDIVQTQIKIASGMTLPELGLTQDKVKLEGVAIQCRITTEDPAHNFQPDSGLISVYRSASGRGIRLDEGPGHVGALVTPHYDSLLVKVTSHDTDFDAATARLRRALMEFRIRGVTTNIPFLINVMDNEQFRTGRATTKFIEENPQLIENVSSRRNRGEKVLRYLANLRVNGHPEALGASGPTSEKVDPVIPTHLTSTPGYSPRPASLRQIYLDKGPAAFAKAVRATKGALITDTTWRDAHQSLLATRVRTIDLLNIAPATREALAGAYSIENWGGATFDVTMRFLRECPWDRLERMRELIPDIPFQMLLRGANAVGYTSYPDNAVKEFCRLAQEKGMDVFRVFDSLNYIENMRLGIEAVGEAGGIIEAAICYSGDITNPSKDIYTLDYYLEFARQLDEAGVHVFAVKDMAGLLKPEAATKLIGALRSEFPTTPIHVHTHDTAGTGVASMIAALRAGADAVDCATDAMSGTTSQPSMGALVHSLHGTDLDTGVDPAKIVPINDYWEDMRGVYAPFESGQKTGSADVYEHEMPGGQYTNLLFQSKQLGLAGQWPAIKRAYAEANDVLGDIIKVTPSSKVVGDLAQFMVTNELSGQDVVDRAADLSFPQSVVEFMQGYLGVPHRGFPSQFQDAVLQDRRLPNGSKSFSGRPGAEMEPLDFDRVTRDIKEAHGHATDTDVMSYVMYPQVFEEWQHFRKEFGDVSILPTRHFLNPMAIGDEISFDVAPGKTLFVKLQSVTEQADESGNVNVDFLMNGEPRTVRVLSNKVAANSTSRRKADKLDPGSVGAPMMGVIVDCKVKVGDTVTKGQPLCVMSAMKMETVVGAPLSGIVKSVEVVKGENVAAGDLVVEIEANPSEEV